MRHWRTIFLLCLFVPRAPYRYAAVPLKGDKFSLLLNFIESRRMVRKIREIISPSPLGEGFRER
jgi:hypothetical protein